MFMILPSIIMLSALESFYAAATRNWNVDSILHGSLKRYSLHGLAHLSGQSKNILPRLRWQGEPIISANKF